MGSFFIQVEHINWFECNRIEWVGVLISWLAMLINSFCILSWIFNCSFKYRKSI